MINETVSYWRHYIADTDYHALVFGELCYVPAMLYWTAGAAAGITEGFYKELQVYVPHEPVKLLRKLSHDSFESIRPLADSAVNAVITITSGNKEKKMK